MKNLILETLLVAGTGILVVGTGILLLAIAVGEVNRPDVYKSWSSKKCVKVQSDSGHHCANLPKKYNTIWVK